MLARSGSLPTRGRWAYEVKWDGFRALVRAGDDFCVRSRRGWDMTALVPELQALPNGVYDGELVAFDDGIPYFPDVCSRLLNGDRTIQLVYMVFDLLALDDRLTLTLPYSERRRLLEQVALPPAAVVSDRFDDGAALFDVVRERGLEGVVAKRLDGRYLPGERAWVKTKNRETWWRYELEREH
jgi:bifunctional non-homologous end joining protein LigD